MEDFRNNSSCLELSIAMPGFALSPASLPSGEINHGSSTMKELLDMNQVPSSGTEDECMEEEDESSNGGPAPRKKLRLTKEQSRLLEETFRLNHTLNPKEKEGLAVQLKLKPRQVEVWFQNRRARSKLKQTEMEFEYLKRWFGSLTEQNRILQKEVEELRAIKVGHHGGRHPTPPSTLTMCPRCERVTTATLGHDDGPMASFPLLHPRQPSAACQH